MRALAVVALACVSATFAIAVACGSSSSEIACPGASLESLSILGPDGGTVMSPAFSPCTTDYYVRCAAGSNDFTVTMKPAPGSTASLLQPTSSSGGSTTVTVQPNQAIVAQAQNDGGATEYWVRCLPPDFPPLEWTPHPEAGAPPPGYYLLGDFEVAQNGSGYAMMLDKNGVPVWYTAVPGGLGACVVENIVPGTVSYIPFDLLASEPFVVQPIDGGAPTDLNANGYMIDPHELRALANGNFLVLSYPFKYGVDLTGLSLPHATDDGGPLPLGTSETIEDCAILEITSSGTVVNAWNASDHFDPRQDTTVVMGQYGPAPPDGGVAYDVFHCNSLDVDPSNGNVLVSARQMSSVFYVAWPSGTVLWKMGGAQASLDNATYVSVGDPFHQQHDARLLEWNAACNGGAGRISVFDDESSSTDASARGVLYDVIVGGDASCTSPFDAGVTPGTASVEWQHGGPANSAGVGSFRISSDGSHVIGWGLIGLPLVFTEVDLQGDDLLDFSFGSAGPSYRVVKVPLSTFDLSVMRKAVNP